MSEVSAGDQTAYAAAKQWWAKPVLNVEPLDEVATADINGAPTYPLQFVTVDNTSADWLDGDANMLFRIEEAGGGKVITWGVLNYDNEAVTAYLDVKSDGDFGYATNEGITISDDDVIRVYRNRPNWAMISRVTESGIQNKRWNKAYTNEGTTPPPVVIMGHDQQADIDTGTNLATFSFVASSSYDWISGATITGFAYTLPTGAVVTGGATNTHSVAFTIAAGIYTVKLVITSSSGITRTAYRTIYANDSGSNKSFGETYAVESIGSDSTDIDGWEGQFTVLRDVSADIYPGAKCHFYVPVFYDGSRLIDNDAFIDVFIGYLTAISISTDSNRVKRSTLTFTSPLKLAGLLPSATQFIEEVATATAWTEVIPGLSDPAYAAYYILQFHTTMIDNHDFLHESDIRLLRREAFGFPVDNINASLQIDGQIMRGDVGCRSDGTITVTQEPSLQSTADRNARDDKFTWTEDNVRERLSIAPTFRPQVAYLIMRAVAYDGNRDGPMIAYASKAPGNAQAQGVTKTNLPNISITVAGGAAELYAVTGHMFAMLNNPLAKIDIPVSKMFDIADPADPDWHTLNISESDYLPITMDLFGVRWSATMRMRPTRVSRSWTRTNGAWVKTITQQNRIESFGRPGVFHPTYKGEIQPWIDPSSGWLVGLDITMPDINIDFDSAAGGLETSGNWNQGWAFNDNGLSGWSNNWNAANPSYAAANPGFDGNVVAQALDGGGGGDGYIVVHDPEDDNPNSPGITRIHIYENPDVAADPTDWTDVSPSPEIDMFFSTNSFPPIVSANIISNSSQTMIVIWSGTNPQYWHKPAGGAWQIRDNIGTISFPLDNTADTPPPPIAQDGVVTWAYGTGFIAEPSNWGIFTETSVGSGIWNPILNHPDAFGSETRGFVIKRGIPDLYVTYTTQAGATNLYRIDDATSTWVDITPSGTFVPRRYNAIDINGTFVRMIATDDSGVRRLYISSNKGDNWVNLGNTTYTWLKRLSNNATFVLGGDSKLDVTINTFGTFHSRLGQWGSIGSIGIMRDFDSKGL